MKRRIFAFLTVLILMFLAGCAKTNSFQNILGNGEGIFQPEQTDPQQNLPQQNNPQQNVIAAQDSWSIYWYLCGSDLESRYGFATTDLQEMLSVDLPENVNIVIQTGGAKQWQNTSVSAQKLQRWVYNSDGLQLIEEKSRQNMGQAQTLYEFLDFAHKNYPAQKEAVLFWNHGGGSVSGAAFDEQYNYDSLTLEEMAQAFGAVWTDRALEMVCFDTCLMATVDVAATFSPYAKYLVASQEVEPGIGWSYDGWISALAQNPSMNGDRLGAAICNTYYDACEAEDMEDRITLSVTDLTKVGNLLTAYEKFGQEALVEAAQDSAFFARLGRAAQSSENYGGNTREQGYSNMVDLGDLARQTAWMLPTAQSVCDALDACVVYRVQGKYRPEATGLSCYYSYNGDYNDFNGYLANGTGEAFKHLYAYGLTGELQSSSVQYLQQLDIYQMDDTVTLQDTNWDGKVLYVDDQGCAVMNLGSQASQILTDINIQLFHMDVENDLLMHLGFDNDLYADWDNGIFRDNFRGVWGAIDDHLVYMELSYEGEDYNLYAVPILLNGEEYNLQVVYDFTTERWNILGASRGLEDSGMASKQLRKLQAGDEITTLWMASTISYDDDLTLYEAETFTVTSRTSFGEAEVFEGIYAMVYEMRDSAGNVAWSDFAYFEVIDGTIYTSIEFPM